MKKDIPNLKAENVSIVVKFEELDGQEVWSVHLLNENPVPIENILIVSKGYGKSEGKEEETSTIRQFQESLDANSSMQIELIQPEVFHLFNEYLLTYYIKGDIYDKKCIFVPESITKENLVPIKLLQANGVLHS